MPRKRSRVHQFESGRYYADLREYADVLEGASGRHVPLVPEGEKVATKSRETAEAVVVQMVTLLEERRRTRAVTGRTESSWTLDTYATHHLALKERGGALKAAGLAWQRMAAMPRIMQFFGADRALDEIGVADVRKFADALLSGQMTGKALAGQSARNYLNALSNLYRRAQEEAVVPLGYNPVAALMDKPKPADVEAEFLEVSQAAALLAAAASVLLVRRDLAASFMEPLLATYLLTGGRRMEVLGLTMDDVSFTRGTVSFRPNRWRALKSRRSRRVLPLWPQLREILKPHWHVRQHVDGARGDDLVFPTTNTAGRQAVVSDFRKSLGQIVAAVPGLDAATVHPHVLRHTYCAARLQTLDRGQPVSAYTVQIEMGHGDVSLINEIYGHLGVVRHRTEFVEYRVA